MRSGRISGPVWGNSLKWKQNQEAQRGLGQAWEEGDGKDQRDYGRRHLGIAHHSQVFFRKQGEEEDEEGGRGREERNVCEQSGSGVGGGQCNGGGAKWVGRPPGSRPQGNFFTLGADQPRSPHSPASRWPPEPHFVVRASEPPSTSLLLNLPSLK